MVISLNGDIILNITTFFVIYFLSFLFQNIIKKTYER
jgi:hypothetical protein